MASAENFKTSRNDFSVKKWTGLIFPLRQA